MSTTDEFLKQARTVVAPENLVTAAADLEAYRHDEFAAEEIGRLPIAVFKPRSETEVAAVLRLCWETRTPVTVRGGGTGLSGGCVPAPGGVVLSTERLRAIKSVDAANQTVTAEAGVSLNELYKQVDAAKLFLPPHPGDESAVLGGVVATNAGGSRAVKYGTIRDFVLGVRAVLPDGRIVELGGTIRKATSGYDFKDLIIGSEGTLAVITQVTLAVLPPPGATYTLVIPFATTTEAIRAVPQVMAAGIVPMAVEFIDHGVIRAAELSLNRTWPAVSGAASLIFILDGDTEDELLGRAERIAEVTESAGALDVLAASTKEQQENVLRIRSMVYEALRPATAELLDVCVPRSQIAGHVEAVGELSRRFDVPLPTYGHAADGNVHTHILHHLLEDGLVGDPIPDWQDLHRRIRAAVYEDAVKRGGVISGEHGIGIVKREALARYTDPTVLELMRGAKQLFDPRGILNPGKIFV